MKPVGSCFPVAVASEIALLKSNAIGENPDFLQGLGSPLEVTIKISSPYPVKAEVEFEFLAFPERVVSQVVMLRPAFDLQRLGIVRHAIHDVNRVTESPIRYCV
ncbi:hypothetical protein V6N13_039823 [Hibiscus sabdariffa]|uniref:Uncharacterized protein n=1 Tax=Hibiscus sabdariffa TaxID=183260 RepID=A0ABR2SU99_9ROSI